LENKISFYVADGKGGGDNLWRNWNTQFYADDAAEASVTPALGTLAVRRQTRGIKKKSGYQGQELGWRGPRLATVTVK